MAGLYAGSFADKTVRQGFMRKVLGIVLLQLLATVAAGAVFYYVQPVKEFVQLNVWPFWAAWAFSFAVLMFMTFSTDARRKYPLNMITLAIFTLAFAFLVGCVTSFYDIQVVLVALAVTAAVVGFIFLIASTSDYDFTVSLGGFVYVASFAFLVTLIVGLFWVNRTLYLIISWVGAVLFSLYLLLDLQMLMGGKMISISPDEYIFAAVHIYLDIINIFLNILSVLTLSSRE
jgi:FtsH-binding integral membrane protein